MKLKVSLFTILICSIVNFSWTQNVSLSNDIGDLNKVTYTRLKKEIGAPDSIIDNSKPVSKTKPALKVIYNDLGITFKFHKLYNQKESKIKRLKSVEIKNVSPIQINGVYCAHSDTASFTKEFSNPNEKWITEFGELVLEYQIEFKSITYLIHVNFTQNGQFTGCTIDLLW